MFLEMASRRRRTASGLPLSAQVQAILAGTNGFAIDATDRSTLWQDTAGTVPALNNGDPVARIDTKWGTTGYTFTNATVAQQAAVHAAGIQSDGSDDIYVGSMLGFISNVPGAFMCARVRHLTLAASKVLLVFGTESTTLPRARLGLGSGEVATIGRRLTADTIATALSSSGLYSSSVFITVGGQIDYAATGSVLSFLNGTQVASATLIGTPGNTPSNPSARVRLFADLNATGFAHCILRRAISIPRTVTNEERAILEAWVAE